MPPSLAESLQQHLSNSGLTKRELARRAGVRPELLSRLNSQQGSDTRTLKKLADALNLDIVLQPKTMPSHPSKARRLGLSMPYDWSNPEISDIALIRKCLEYANLADLTRLALEFGVGDDIGAEYLPHLTGQSHLTLAGDLHDLDRHNITYFLSVLYL